MTKTFIVKLGGSILVPDINNINVGYVVALKDIIKSFPDYQFVITLGGGYTCRWYQKALNDAGFTDETMQHEIGVASIHLNAEFVNAIFHDISNKDVYYGIGEPKFEKQVLITGAWVPGSSSNCDAAEMAIKLESHDVINLSNIDYIYTKDPRKFPDAKKIEQISWEDYRKLFNHDRHLPGQNIPVDVLAADLAAKHNIRFYFVDGHNLSNLKKIFEEKKFDGTIIG